MSVDGKPKVLLAVNVPPNNMQLLKENFEVLEFGKNTVTYEEALKCIPGVDALFTYPAIKVDKQLLNAAGPKLKVVGTISVGYDHIDLEECKKRNIKVGYLGPMLADVMAEFTVGLMIATGRRFGEALRHFSEWKELRGLSWLNGIDILDSTIGIVGFGFIGQSLAKKLKSLEPKGILYTGPHKKQEGDALGVEYTTLDHLLKESDFVIASCALNNQTQKLFNRETFKKMKPTSIFINISRGGVVDHDDLYEALTNKTIWAAGLDVTTPEPFPPDHPLTNLDNCIILPHMGTASAKLRAKMYEMTSLNLIAGIKGEKLPIQLV